MHKRTLTLALVLLLVITLAAGLSGCGSQNNHASPPSAQVEPKPAADSTEKGTKAAGDSLGTEKSSSQTFTPEELAKYDGKNGNLAYVAVNGIVYDVSTNRVWREGQHESYRAGRDLSHDMSNSPHGMRVLDGLPVVGKMAK